MEQNKENKVNLSISMDKVRDKEILDFLKSKRNKSDYIRQMLYNLATNGSTTDADVVASSPSITENKNTSNSNDSVSNCDLPSDNIIMLNNLLLKILSLLSQGNFNVNNIGMFNPAIVSNNTSSTNNIFSEKEELKEEVPEEPPIPDYLMSNMLSSIKDFKATP